MSMWWMSQLAAPGERAYLLTLADVFLLFFIMIGPIKSIGPYAAATAALPADQARKVAWKVFAICAVTVLVAGLLGGSLLQKWHIPPPILQLAGGLVFLLVALQLVLAQYRPVVAADPSGGAAAPVAHLAFPVTLPAYGIAALIVLVAMSGSGERLAWILALALGVLVLDLLMMLFVRPLLHALGPLPLQILGAVLGMLQVALALQLMASAIHQLRTWPWAG